MVKKIILFSLSLLSVGSCTQTNARSQPQRSFHNAPNKKIFFEAQNLKDQKKFYDFMNNTIKYYKGNPDGFFQFMITKNEDTMTPLMIASSVFDTKQVIFLLDKFAEFYGPKLTEKEKKYIFDYLDARDKEGNSAFFFATQNGDYPTIKAMVDRVAALLQDNELLLKFLNATVYADQWTSLHWLVYDNAMRSVEYLIPTIEKIFGKNSSEYDDFINAKNEEGSTPLNYALTPDCRKFLIDHGAIILNPINPQIRGAQTLSAQFIEAMHDGAFGKMQKIMAQAQEEYKSNADLFFEFITAKDEGGWDIMLHATAQGRYEYVAYILYATERFFKGKSLQYMYDILSSVSIDGHASISIAILRRNFEIAKLLIEKIKQYSQNKYLFYMIMNTTSYPKGLTPLLSSVFFGSDKDEFYEITKLILESIAERFGKNSHIMDLFVNTRNYDGFTALSYVASKKIKKLLQDYGAHE